MMKGFALSQVVFVMLTAVAMAANPAEKDKVRVECRGQLRTGIVAIGGETTGTTVTFDRITWELQLPDDVAREFVKAHDKKYVSVVGSLRQVTGTQIPVRWIVDVEKITAGDDSQKVEATVTLKGTLQTCDTKDAVKPLAVDSRGVKWPVDLSRNAGLESKGKQLTGKKVVVKGSVQRVSEPAGPVRTFVQASSLDASTD